MIRPVRVAVLAAALLLVLAGCGRGFSGAAPEQIEGPATLRMLITSNGPEDTAVVEAAVQEWAQRTGSTVNVQVASELQQQIAQGFAGGNPPDVFFVDAARIQDYAGAGNLVAYGETLPMRQDIVPTLAEAFTVGGTLQCAPKDSSNLGLVIDNERWAAAGLTDADIPTDWAGLADVAARLTGDGVTGLTMEPNRDRVGAFMAQAGGWYVNDDQSLMTMETPENLAALEFLQGGLREGWLRYPAQIDSGWGGEAIGNGRAAMTIEGNWFAGAVRTDYPDLDYRVVELPAGPAGPATLSFTTCWGVAVDSPYQAQAVDLVEHLMSPENQLTFSQAFGVIPALGSLAEPYREAEPQAAAWLAGNDYATPPVNARGLESVMDDFDTRLQGLATGDPAELLRVTQANGTAAIEANR